jgi:hypothetical protein
VREAERLRAHVVGCEGCRREFDALRHVRDRLRGAPPDGAASRELTDRLVSIAGSEAAEPLYARPFVPALPGPGVLPSRRQQTRRVVLGVFTVTCVVIAGLVGVGWAAAPTPETVVIDPGPIARDEFAAVLTERPLANPAVIGARAVEFTDAKTGQLHGPPDAGGPLLGNGARELLERADAAPLDTSFAGRQLVQVRHLAGFWVAEVDVEGHPEHGTRVTFPGRIGAGRSALLPVRTPGRVGALSATHQLLTGPGPEVAGRDSTIVEAHRAGRPVARWWLDIDTGLVLWQQLFDDDGRITLSAGFRSVAIGPVDSHGSLPPRLVRRGDVATLDLVLIDGLRSQGWLCSRKVADLELVTIRRSPHDRMVHTVYGNDVVTLSVLEQKGTLTDTPSGFVWDPEQGVYRSLGMTTMYSWQSGESIFTVVTDAPTAVAERAIKELPHSEPVFRSHSSRILAGWNHLLGEER